MIRAKLEGDKLSIPKAIIQKAGLRDGEEVEVRFEDGKVIVKPLADTDRFKKELKGCIKKSKIYPLDVKKI
ncbi:MAG: AbrB/MazE/SpoVT family DNA-binding domain-containing protein [Euryarchaeota archaeon]|nr:AbrB/MazE/SpoVT family DNA-binding domain-containing protein [Euryarchaeota archaeon]